MFNESSERENLIGLEEIPPTESKELTSFFDLSDEEQEELNEQFFNENPQYLWVREKKEKALNDLNKTLFNFSPFLFILVAIGFFVGAILVSISSGNEAPAFKLLLGLFFASLLAFIIAIKVHSKKSDNKIDKFNNWMESPEYKDFDKAYDDFLKTKGYYCPEEDEE